ncbi:unnamed protein product [Schistosoma rodhaini]|uniref:hypothetical protein n=1 Tax=Schistosoma mansoni TaxID=6183 RepID=UPI00022DC91B|nr:hypothetical protein Smp_178010 [Schistosoma mansoni]CAH8483824.1 unnamed protein product [Schistosoma rodhaini]|eukprot:XP_018647506.1 hypothetical protein Smp_178010 [Schistosoma mansoni]
MKNYQKHQRISVILSFLDRSREIPFERLFYNTKCFNFWKSAPNTTKNARSQSSSNRTIKKRAANMADTRIIAIKTNYIQLSKEHGDSIKNDSKTKKIERYSLN